jgi:hypothetical protein
MQRCLDRLSVPLMVVWTPDKNHEKHGLIELTSRTLFLFDEKEEDAWETFTHESLEYRFKGVCETYRTIINSLIEVLEKVAYSRKEEFLEFIPRILEEVKKGSEQD